MGPQVRRPLRPDKKNLARCVIDDEAGVVSEATRAEPAAVPVTGQRQRIHFGAGGHDLALRPPSRYLPRGVPAEPGSRGVREFALGPGQQ